MKRLTQILKTVYGIELHQARPTTLDWAFAQIEREAGTEEAAKELLAYNTRAIRKSWFTYYPEGTPLLETYWRLHREKNPPKMPKVGVLGSM